MSSLRSSTSRSASVDEAPKVLPGFVDPHLHLLAAAAARRSVDLTDARSPASIAERLRHAAATLPAGRWIRATGYDASLVEAGQLDRRMLDGAVAERPVVVHEVTGHLVIFNTMALRRIDPTDCDDRRVEWQHGALTGRIFDGGELLTRVPRLPEAELRDGLAQVGHELAAAGVTAVTDATHTNGLSELRLLAAMRADGVVRQHVEAMVSLDALDELTAAGLGYGDRVGAVTVGHVKLVPEARTSDTVASATAAAVARGWPVAIHVLDIAELEAAIDALHSAPPPAGTRHRLEHVALSLPEQVQRLARCGAAVVTQPEFPVRRRHKYERELAPGERPLLYRMRSLRDAGITVAAASDRPVLDTTPLRAFGAACGAGIAATAADPRERVSPAEALDLITGAAGAVGSVIRGTRDAAPGDYVVLDAEPTAGCVPRVLETYVEGQPIYRCGQ